LGGENSHFDYLTTVDIAIEEDFIPLYLCRSNQDEWDDFESRHTQQLYLQALESADEEAFDRMPNWQRGYLKWGIDPMGFCFIETISVNFFMFLISWLLKDVFRSTNNF
jgi:hypothetical protein